MFSRIESGFLLNRMLLACALCFFQFTLHIHEAEVHTNTKIFFENFSHLPLFAIFASLHFLLQLHLRREYETSLRCEKVIEQNDTGTTQIIAYAFTFIIYANA